MAFLCRERLTKAATSSWMVPAALLGLCLISYGTMASRLGYYWDDWHAIWYAHFLGPSRFLTALLEDRPLLGPFYMLTSLVAGEAPLHWQIMGIFTRWLMCLAFWWALTRLWPHKTWQVASIAFLFTVYPGFKQQYIAITYSQLFIVLALSMFSLGALFQATRNAQRFWPWYLASLASGGYALFASEYYFGVELLRPVLLWLVLSETIVDLRQRRKRFRIYWTPFAILTCLFLVYRLTIPTTRGHVTFLGKLAVNPISAILDLGKMAFEDIFTVSLLAWKQTLDIAGLANQDTVTILKYALTFLAGAAFAILFLIFLRPDKDLQVKPRLHFWKSWSFQLIVIGLFALLVAGIPFWMVDLRPQLSFTRDRHTLPMMLGASLLVMGLILLVARRRIPSILITGIVVGLAAGLHVQNALTYRLDWFWQQEFFWQLIWRVPELEPGTAVLTADTPYFYNWDNSLATPLNWIYAPEHRSPELPYFYYNIESDISRGEPGPEAGKNIHKDYRIISFDSPSSRSVSVFYRPTACLKVIMPGRDEKLPAKPRYFDILVQFSNPDLIVLDPAKQAVVPTHVFGPEPEHGWCYYFEKAELSGQIGDWQSVARLGDEAFKLKKDFNHDNVAELSVFIAGYARSGQLEKAIRLTDKALSIWGNMRFILCDTWNDVQIPDSLEAQTQAALEQMRQTLDCSAP